MPVTYKFDKEVAAEIPRHLILVDDLFHLWVMLDVTLKQVQWRVVSVEQGILDVLLQRDLQLTAGVTLSNLEERVTKTLP